MGFKIGRRARTAAIGTIAVAALSLTACTGGGGGIGSPDTNSVSSGFSDAVDGAIESAMQQSGSTAAVVGVWTEEGEYLRAYGDEEIDSGVQFRGAQATQPVMCALLLQLAEDGTVGLDDEVSDDLTRQVGIEDITYRQLCTGTTGLADFKKGFDDIFTNNPARPWGPRELLAQGLAESPTKWPGLNFNQSDTNALLLARALQVRTGTQIGALLDEYVYEPAEMSASYYPAREDTELQSGLNGLTYPSSGGEPVCDADPVEVPQVSPTMLSGAGATVTTVTDLKKFYSAFLDGEFGGEEFGSLPTDVIPTKNPKRDKNGDPVEESEEAEEAPDARMWGFGAERIGPLYGRSGSITGTLTAAYHDPSTDYTVVVAVNNSSAGSAFIKALAFEIASLSSENGVGPEVPWTAEDQTSQLAEHAVCQ